MSRETVEYLDTLREGRDDQGPQINWTRGFEGSYDQFHDYREQRSGSSQGYNHQANNNSWDRDSDDETWW
jgi:hypothetical protein